MTKPRKTIGFETLEARKVPAFLHVGPLEPFKVPSQAAAAAHDGDTILIDSGTYLNDLATFNANNLRILGVGTGRAKVDDTGLAIPNRKAIWVINGNNTTVANIEFAGAHDNVGIDKNWAGIREQGSTLTIRNSYFHNNDDGILVNAGATSDITIISSEFAHNGYGDGFSHNMYIGQVRSFTLEYSDSHDAVVGHLVKSRALTNFILYNNLSDGPTGSASYELDLPNGGASYVVGNVIEQGPDSMNPTIISYAEEGAVNPAQTLELVNNTIVNDKGSGTFVRVVGSPTDVRLINNIFDGGGTVLSGPGTLITNLVTTTNPGFVDAANGDDRLVDGSPAINHGTNPGVVNGISLTPTFEYFKRFGLPRPKHGIIDIGAYEY